MHPRTTVSGRSRRGAHARRRPPARRPGLFLGIAAAGAVLVNVLAGAEPAAQAEAGAEQPVSVAAQLGLSAEAGPAPTAGTTDLRPLEDLAAGRSTREAAAASAQQVQAAADQAELDRRTAEAETAAKAEAAARAAAEASVAAAAAAPAAAAPTTTSVPAPAAAPAAVAGPATARVTARISNSSGAVKASAQAAADAVVSGVPGAAGLTIGGTRPSATDPGGHPSGLALDYMVGTDDALGDAIARYQIDHWDALGVEYVIWQQRMLSSPGGSWEPMADRGSATANHYDHVHVNYLG